MKKQMKTKNVLVSFLAIMAVFVLASTVSASCGNYTGSELADIYQIKVDGNIVTDNNLDTENIIESNIMVEAGDAITVKVWFTPLNCDTDVRLKVELEDVEVESSKFAVECGFGDNKALSIKVPYELKDERSDFIDLKIELKGDDYETEVNKIILRVERPLYNVDIKSISTSQTVEAGETFPVDIVLKNIGYNDLDDLYVKASISSLGIERTGYFGDLVALECDNTCGGNDEACNEDGICPYKCCNEDEDDTITGRLYLKVPYEVQAGVYTIEVEVRNDDTTSTKTTDISVQNDFEKSVFKSGNSVWIVNPTDNVVGYRVVPESPASASESIVFVPAGSSKSVIISPNVEGEYTFSVNVFTLNGELVETVTFSGNNGPITDDKDDTEVNPVVILTVILAIIFIVLLIVLIVLIGKKPEKSGEFGESYY